jgi:transposase
MRRVGRARNASRSDAAGAHARRKFFEAVELNPQDQSAIGIVAQMDELFAIDAQPREQAINQQDRQLLRLEKSKPLLAEIKTQIQTARSGALPKSALAKACNYTLTLWARLTRFLEYPELELSNNLAENAMRPVALGRRYEQSGIRQSLTRAKRDFRRWALDMADGATLPIFA